MFEHIAEAENLFFRAWDWLHYYPIVFIKRSLTWISISASLYSGEKPPCTSLCTWQIFCIQLSCVCLCTCMRVYVCDVMTSVWQTKSRDHCENGGVGHVTVAMAFRLSCSCRRLNTLICSSPIVSVCVSDRAKCCSLRLCSLQCTWKRLKASLGN